MTTFRRWAVPLALAGGATIGAFAVQVRRNRLHRTSRLHAHQVQAWEGEGGGNTEAVPSPEPATQVDPSPVR